MARQKNQHDCIRSEPQPLTEFRPDNFEAEYKRRFDELASSSSEDSDSEDDGEGKKSKAAAVDSDDEWNAVSDDRQTKRTK